MSFIPPITDPLGAHWKQPALDLIQVNDTCAIMSREALEQLVDYSCSIPTGVYVGKMWRCRVDFEDASKGWLLKWYGESDKPGYVSNNARPIQIISDITFKQLLETIEHENTEETKTHN